jgi:hypothetical protein
LQKTGKDSTQRRQKRGEVYPKQAGKVRRDVVK